MIPPSPFDSFISMLRSFFNSFHIIYFIFSFFICSFFLILLFTSYRFYSLFLFQILLFIMYFPLFMSFSLQYFRKDTTNIFSFIQFYSSKFSISYSNIILNFVIFIPLFYLLACIIFSDYDRSTQCGRNLFCNTSVSNQLIYVVHRIRNAKSNQC